MPAGCLQPPERNTSWRCEGSSERSAVRGVHSESAGPGRPREAVTCEVVAVSGWQDGLRGERRMQRWLGGGETPPGGSSQLPTLGMSNSYHGEPYIPADVFNVSRSFVICG